MRSTIAVCIMAALCTTPAAAQSGRFYVGGVTGIDSGSRGPISGGALPTLGGTLGLRLSEGWSVEVELERGVRKRVRSDEGLWLSRVGAGATREEIERHAVHARFDRIEEAGLGWSLAAAWKSRAPGRVNAGLFGGITSRRFSSRTIRTITAVGPDVDPSPSNPDVLPNDDTRTIAGGGLTGGAMLLLRLTPALTMAPEFRWTLGLITDESTYKVARLGVRVMWGF